MARIFISAAHKSSGKTTISIGLCRILKNRGLHVQPFKKGPDYIDPMWLGRAAGRDCHNLDFYTMAEDEIRQLYESLHGVKRDHISMVEGNKGLYDGLDIDGSNSNAALAKLLRMPVVLVIDARGMTRGIAPLILGYRDFDPGIHIAGIILNQLGGSRHESKLRAVIEHYTDIPVLGAVHRHGDLELEERHLGLMPSNETRQAEQKIEAIATRLSSQVDVERLLRVAVADQAVHAAKSDPPPEEFPRRFNLTIGVFRDRAFGFYYPGDLQAMESQGARIVYINAFKDRELPAVDGLFIGGGFPETHLDELSENQSLMSSVREAVERGLPVYAECGGLMYLAESITWKQGPVPMAAVIPGRVVMQEKPQGRGYVRLKPTQNHPWPDVPEDEIMAHEFHYSRLEGFDSSAFAFQVLRGHGIDGHFDGIVHGSVLAGYVHMRHTRRNPWTSRFLAFVDQCKTNIAQTSHVEGKSND